jgi:F-type H+-transporting ATPase subunit delta
MKISKQSRRDAKALYNACRSGGLLDEARVRQTVSAVIDRKPRGYVATLSHFSRLVRLEIGRRTAVVESAADLQSGFQDTVKANLARKYGAGLNVSFAVNPALIGGLRIRVGSDVLDGSVTSRLNSMADNL